MKKILKKYGYLPYFLVSILLLANYLLFHNRIYLIFFSYWLFLAFVDFAKKGKLQVQVSHPDKPVSACCN